MFTKLILIGVATTGIMGTGALGTGALGTGAASGITPTGIEFAAGPIRIEAGNGKFISAHMAQHTSLTLTVNLQGDRKLQIKF